MAGGEMQKGTRAYREAVQALLEGTRCMDLLKRQHGVIEVDAQATISEGCDVLVRNGISSAPVYDAALGSYVGMLDYRDIVDYVLVVFRKKTIEPILEDAAMTVNIVDIVERASVGDAVFADAIADLSRKNPFYSVMSHASLVAAIAIFAANVGIHRINVVSDAGRVIGLLSKTDVVRFLRNNMDVFGEEEHKSISAIGLGRGPVISISANASVLDALERTSKHAISSIPVTDDGKHLMGNISMADIRFIFQRNRFDRLWLSCARFISLALTEKGLESGGQDCYPVFDVHPSVTLERVMEKLLATRTHRIWVTASDDSDGELLGVISMTDIIHHLCIFD